MNALAPKLINTILLVILLRVIYAQNCGVVATKNVRKIRGAFFTIFQFYETFSSDQFFLLGVKIASPYPWFVGLVQLSAVNKIPSSIFCLGSIISAKDVLTAAHCVTTVSSVGVVANIEKSSSAAITKNLLLKTSKIISHPNYILGKPWYDFAILQLVKSVSIMPICLPSSNDPMVKFGTAVILNKTNSEQQDLVMPTVEMMECRRMLLRNSYFFEQKVRTIESGFCAGYLNGTIDTCQGDSGGPFQAPSLKTVRYTILGVTSFGFGCKIRGTLGVYSDVRDVVWWIRKVVAAITFKRGE